MQRVLLENYILEQIHLIERESYYNHDLLEEGKILDFFKNSFSKVKDFFIANPDREKTLRNQVEKYKEKGDLEKAKEFDDMLDSLQTGTYVRQNIAVLALLCGFIYIKETNKGKSPEKAAENTIEQVSNIESNNGQYNFKGTSLEEPFENVGFNKPTMSEKEVMEGLYLLTGTEPADFESEDDTSSEDASQSQTSEMFYNYMEGTFTDYTVKDFNDMSQEDFDYIVDEYEKFLNEEAFKFTDKEYNQAMSLAFLLKSSDNYNLDSDVIKGPSDRLKAVHGALQTIDDLSTSLPDPDNLSPDVTQEELEQRISDMVNGQIAEVEKLRNDLEDKYNNPDNEEYYDKKNEVRLAMYDDMISQIEDRFYDSFKFELMKKR